MVDQGLEDNEEPTIPFSGLCVRGMLQAASNRLCLERKILPYVGKVEKTPGQPRRLAEPLVEGV